VTSVEQDDERTTQQFIVKWCTTTIQYWLQARTRQSGCVWLWVGQQWLWSTSFELVTI